MLEQQQLIGYDAPLALGHQRPLQLDGIGVSYEPKPPNLKSPRSTHGEAG
jgi:hypothetical protein